MRKIHHYWGFIRIHSIICGYVARKNVKTKMKCKEGGLNLRTPSRNQLEYLFRFHEILTITMIIHKLARTKHTRDDGWLCELVSINYNDQPFSNIHSYIVSITPEKTRANHFHKFKEEWLCLSAGKIKIYLEDVRSHKKEMVVLLKSFEHMKEERITSYLNETIRIISQKFAKR